MIEILEKKNCCGCAACDSICPKNCISMQEDNEGFIYPIVDKISCVNCGLCESVCPIKLENISNSVENTPLKTLIGYTQDCEVRISSSSGGIFTDLARAVLSNGGYVAGAMLNEKFEVEHILINSVEDLDKLRGSKYIQSHTKDVFSKIKRLLENNSLVLFSGTPCQVAGLKSYLKKEYKTLYTVDVLCHGVPTLKLWKRYLSELEKKHGAKASSVSFRNKRDGWRTFRITIAFENGKVYDNYFFDDAFMKLFLGNICLRPSCHDCKFKALNSLSDISIGDCWGVEKFDPEMFDDKGTSVILIHSTKGQYLFDSVSHKFRTKEMNVDVCLPKSADSRRSVLPHPNRKRFFKLVLRENIEMSNLLQLLNLNVQQKIVRKIKKILNIPYK